MAGWYEISTSANDKISFVLKAGNAEVILRSQQYASMASAENGVASVQANCALDERYEKLEASDGCPYFNLKAANSQIIGTSQMYAAASGRDNGIASVKTNGVSKTIKQVGP